MAVVKFTNPPLIEVVLAVQLGRTNFSSVHFGLYWQNIRNRFPEWLERPPLIFDEDDFDEDDDAFLLPPLRRVLFTSSDNQKLIQIQDNFFSYNWRYKDQQEYPHFEEIFKEFLYEWNDLREWWSKVGLSLLEPSCYRLTYLNLIDKDSGWTNTGDHQKIFTFTGGTQNNFLETPEFQDINLTFLLPNNEGTLAVNLDQRISEAEDSQAVLFELTTFSFEGNKDLINWFQNAHDYIAKAFLVLTKEDAQEKWGRYET